MLILLLLLNSFHFAATQILPLPRQKPAEETVRNITTCSRTHILDDAPTYYEFKNDNHRLQQLRVDQYRVDGDLILGGVLDVCPANDYKFELVSDLPVPLECSQRHILDDAPVYYNNSLSDCKAKVDHYIADGDVILGAVLAVSVKKPKDYFLVSDLQSAFASCHVIPMDLWQVLTFAFVIDEINKREDLLPNITLGFEIYDSGICEITTIERTFRILSGNHKLIPNYSCRKQEKVLALIGHLVPSCSQAMADLLSLYKYTQVSYGAKDPMLDNKDQYPYIFSTIPSELSLNEAVVALLQYFEWKWVGIIAYSDVKFERPSEEMKKEIIKIGYCVEFFIVVGYGEEVFLRGKIQKSHANVIIIYCSFHTFTSASSLFFNSNGKVLITITEGGKFLSDDSNFYHANGSIWFSRQKEDILGLKGFIQSESSTPLPGNTFLDTFLEDPLIHFQDGFSINQLHNIYTTVYVAAHALHGLAYKPQMKENRNQQILQKFIPWQLNGHMKNVSFTIPDGKEIYFDERGNVPGYFDIWNVVIFPNRSLVNVAVGTFDSSAPQGEKLKLNVNKIKWHPDFIQVPKSVCVESCSPGYRKAPREGQQACCYDCVLCPEGEISYIGDMDNCIKCKAHEWTDDRRDKCIQRETEYLSFHDYLGICLTAICLFLCVITTGIYSIFYRHRATCIVRANNLHLSYILLFSLTLSFLSSLLFIGRPKQVTCLVRQVTFGIIFATELSTLIGKTITVIIAFSATKPGSKLAKWMKTQITYRILLLLLIGQVIICSVWLVCSPPFPDTDTKSKTGMIILLCNEGSVVAFYIMIGYIGILAIVSFLLAYYARRLPDSFNESQLITFSMLVFCSVWVSFIPAYINTKGRSVVAVEVFAILTSNAGLLGFIFIPKCYIILFRPELNTKEHLMRKI
uniref:G-protein coupled receptors family 3 profile domain-containing protein n=1 Tax=Xenopus tropicalis TaxID=8364 RepID=A0A803JCI4_XENTR